MGLGVELLRAHGHGPIIRPGRVLETDEPLTAAVVARLTRPTRVSGLMTAAFPPSIRPVAENAEHVAMIVDGVANLRAAMPMLEVDLHNAAIVDALVERGEVTLTLGPGNRLEIS